MKSCKIDIQIQQPFKHLVKRDWLRQVVQQTLSSSGLSSPCELGLVIADDNTVQSLNRQYRHQDSSTDVLAFCLVEEQRRSAKGFVSPPDGIRRLGEVIVCYPQAERQAREYHHPVQQELALLVTHGVLHLLGYDHDKSEAEEKMKAKEAEISANLEKRPAKVRKLNHG